jgi:transposase
MFHLGSATRIFLVSGPTDMRQGFNGLSAIVANALKEDPLSGHLFVFCNQNRNRLKILFWDRAGFWLCAKRLERGTFAWPDSNALSVALSGEELTLLLGGIDLQNTRKRKWFEGPRQSCLNKLKKDQ